MSLCDDLIEDEDMSGEYAEADLMKIFCVNGDRLQDSEKKSFCYILIYFLWDKPEHLA